jgi:hypothetical protein
LDKLIAVICGQNFKNAVSGPGFKLVKSWMHGPSTLEVIKLAQERAFKELKDEYFRSVK